MPVVALLEFVRLNALMGAINHTDMPAHIQKYGKAGTLGYIYIYAIHICVKINVCTYR